MHTSAMVRRDTKFYVWVAVAGALAIFAAGAIGGMFTTPSIQDGWYASLTKPPMQPPNSWFGPVWSVLYVLIAASWVLAYRARPERLEAIAYPYLVQVILNGLWSVLFFGMKLPMAGLVTIVLLLVSIVWTMLAFRINSRLAAWLLAPYLAWVSFATYLNAGIVALN